jgi:hypothetical protein
MLINDHTVSEILVITALGTGSIIKLGGRFLRGGQSPSSTLVTLRRHVSRVTCTSHVVESIHSYAPGTGSSSGRTFLASHSTSVYRLCIVTMAKKKPRMVAVRLISMAMTGELSSQRVAKSCAAAMRNDIMADSQCSPRILQDLSSPATCSSHEHAEIRSRRSVALTNNAPIHRREPD